MHTRAKRRGFGAVLVAGVAALFAGTASAQTTIEWITWSSAERLPADEAVARAFEAENPDIKVEVSSIPGANNFYEKMNLLISVGDTPDLAGNFDGWAAAWHEKGVMEDLRPFIDADPDKQEILDSLAGMNLYEAADGAVEALPWTATSFFVYYNVDLFEKEGVPLPTADWTFDEFLETARKLTKRDESGKVVQWGAMNLASYDFLIRWIWDPFGGYYVNDDFSRCGFDDPATIKGLDFYQTLYKEELIPSFSYTVGVGDQLMWQSGSVGMLMHHQTGIQQFVSGSEFEWQVQYIPIGAAGERVTRGSGAGFGILKNSEHKEEAWRLLKFMTIGGGADIFLAHGAGTSNQPYLAEYVKTLKDSPQLNISEGSFNDASQEVYVSSLQFGRPVKTPPNNAEIEGALAPYWDELRLATRPTAEIAADMQSACMKLLAELR